MPQNLSRGGDIALVLLGGIPAIGPFFRKKEKAVARASFLLKTIDDLVSNAHVDPYQITFKRQANGYFTLVIKNKVAAANVLSGIDELLLKRFQKTFRYIFILTSFYEVGEKLECLAVTEGLGAVLYSCYDFIKFFQSK